jgi:hypothetical protein
VLYSDNNFDWSQRRFRNSWDVAGWGVTGGLWFPANHDRRHRIRAGRISRAGRSPEFGPAAAGILDEKKAAAAGAATGNGTRGKRDPLGYLSSSPSEDGLEVWPPECPHDGSRCDGAGLEAAAAGAAQLGAAGAGLGAGAGFGAATVGAGLGAAGFGAAGLAETAGAALFAALAFLADFFGAALDFLADFFTDFFADFFAFFADFFAAFFEVFFELFLADFFFAVTSFFLLFLFFLLFFPLAIVVLLLPLIQSIERSSRPLSRGANRSVQSWPETACRPIEKLNRVNHRN